MKTTSKSETKFFLVDDDLYSLAVYQQGLTNMGYSDFSMFYNGTHCINNLHQKPTIVFLDYNMDDYSGLEVLEKIKRFNPNIFVIVVSGQENMNVAVNVLKHGAFDYIVKGDNELEKMEEVIHRIESIQTHIQTKKRSFVQKLLSVF